MDRRDRSSSFPMLPRGGSPTVPFADALAPFALFSLLCAVPLRRTAMTALRIVLAALLLACIVATGQTRTQHTRLTAAAASGSGPQAKHASEHEGTANASGR